MQNEQAGIKREVLLAAAVLTAYRKAKESSKPARIEDVARVLFELRQAGINLGEISLKRIPGGFYSEDVEILIGHYLDAKFATKRSPVQLSEHGRELLSSIIKEERKENPLGLQEVEQVLGGLA
jgi:hypothetical protein